ncbi:hypothetical protein SAMN04487981_104132 [Streptomyces sp. cf386]|uniref:hypothetical protein n=1 Tax=Streptomyces sp. cf386 TaxID=1761904 RepID=UPI0008901A9B|nr:hypothetical protein [Streptomyces sp. cf386]SDN22645.1 hypothetical protein SAMN04487981_104132 [Streptomyces sp. cf386]
MQQLIGAHWKEALRLGPETRAHHILWPASFPGTPRARGPAHALAALLFLIATSPPLALFMAIQVLTMCEVLGGRLRDARGVGHRLLTAAAWILWALTFLYFLSAFTGVPDVHSSMVPPELVSQVRSLLASAAVCWLVGLAAGSSAAWVTWVLSDCRVRPVTLYTVWLATTTIMAALAIR